MLLLVDAGNTRIKWALVDGAAADAADSVVESTALGRWRAFGSASHAEVGTLAQAWQVLPVARVLLSNVAGTAVRAVLEDALRHSFPLNTPVIDWFASVAALAGIRNGYHNPSQLGCDRFASMIAAHALFPQQALIVATCGTATTVDAVDRDGLFLGGMILPGLGLMASALASNTAQLPQVAAQFAVAQPFADHTDAAIVSGCLMAQAGAIERAVAAHPQQPVLCVVAGGAAAYIAPHLSVTHQIVDNLVLIGLQTVALRQQT